MTVSPIVVLHIFMGSVALLSGGAALIFRKGERWHINFGSVFFGSMLGMSASGAFLAFMKGERINIVVGILTFYLVATAWATVRKGEGKFGLFEIAACPVALAVGIWGITLGVEALNSELGYLDGDPSIPFGAYFFFGSMAILAGLLDIKMFARKGVFGKQRIARHLWRMCFALLIAAASLFLGQSQVFPEAIQDSFVLVAPVLIVLILLFFWLIRVLFTSWYKEA